MLEIALFTAHELNHGISSFTNSAFGASPKSASARVLLGYWAKLVAPTSKWTSLTAAYVLQAWQRTNDGCRMMTAKDAGPWGSREGARQSRIA